MTSEKRGEPREVAARKPIIRLWNARGCSYCFPHGRETDNATMRKNTRSWKRNRRTRHKPVEE